MNYYKELKENWIKYLKIRKIGVFTLLSALLLGVVLTLFPIFLNDIESRDGFSFVDPIAGKAIPVDLTWFIFSLIYLSLAAAIVLFAREPARLLTAVNSYSLLLLFRMAAMYLLPLEPPASMIPLADPFVEFFGTGSTLTKDLFFSGHTATMFLLFLNSEGMIQKILLLIATLLVGIAVVIQHVHYSADVYAAPFFAYVSYAISKYLWYKTNI